MLKVTDECTACGACLSICPKSCISFKSNEEGFLYPHIDIEMCRLRFCVLKFVF